MLFSLWGYLLPWLIRAVLHAVVDATALPDDQVPQNWAAAFTNSKLVKFSISFVLGETNEDADTRLQRHMHANGVVTYIYMYLRLVRSVSQRINAMAVPCTEHVYRSTDVL